MNRSRRGEKLHEKISLAQSNARWWFQGGDGKTHRLVRRKNEKNHLETLIKKAQSRILQIDEDLKAAKTEDQTN